MNIIFNLLLGLSFLCWVVSWVMFFQRKNNLIFTNYLLSIANSTLQLFYLTFFSFNEHWSDSSRLLLICALVISILFIFSIRKKNSFYWGIVLPGFVFFLLFLAGLLSQHRRVFLSDGFTSQTNLLYAHIVFFILTYLLLSIVFLTSLFFLFRHFQLRNKKIAWKKEIPSLNSLHKISSWLINFSFFTLSLAVIFAFLIQPPTLVNLSELSFRVLVPILLWFIYGTFILAKNFWLFSNLTEARLNIFIYAIAICSFIYEIILLIK